MVAKKLKNEIKTVLVTGGTGLVGSELSRLLTHEGYSVTHLSRNPSQKHYPTYFWDVKKGKIEEEAIHSADAIIHLAGAGVADRRWSKEWKEEIYASRISSTQLLHESVKKINPGLTYFLSASAIGYYGWDTGSQWVEETTEKGAGFLADVVEDWEKEVKGFDELEIKNGVVRIGIVLSNKGGALMEMSRPVRLGLGASLASGQQYMSWIHIQDLCGIFLYMLETQSTELVNGVSPCPEKNEDFTKKIAKYLHKPLWLPNVPKFVLRLIIGEMANILAGGNRVSSKKIEKLGYKFLFPTLDQSLQDLL